MKNTKNLSTTRIFALGSLVVLALFGCTFFLIKGFKTRAYTTVDIPTEVTVGNASPKFMDGYEPVESPASSTTSPTAIGGVITFKANAEDSNGEPYYMTICRTDSITEPDTTGPGTCSSAANTLCTSIETASGQQATCQYTAKAGDSWNNQWYAFVCDNNAEPACSTGHQGLTGEDASSPFYVNHAPTFTAISNNSPKNPGATVTWTATASDPDNNQVKLVVCKKDAANGGGISNGACVGESWCVGELSASNPTCSYEMDEVHVAGTFDAYVYVVDAHNLPASGGSQEANSTFTVNNMAPVVTNVTLNDGNNIVLEENTTVNVEVKATVTDKNGCSNVQSVYANVYRSSVTCTNIGHHNPNNCYTPVTCNQVEYSCVESSGVANYVCKVSMQFHADPTDANTPYTADNWLANVHATDVATATGNLVLGTGVEVNSLLGFSITGTINYGELEPGDSNEYLDKVLTTTPTGNTGINQDHSGSEYMCTDFDTCSTASGFTPIYVSNQKYALTSNILYSDTTNAFVLGTSPATVLLKIPKPLSTSPTGASTYWGINIPGGTATGVYSGSNTITAQKSATGDW